MKGFTPHSLFQAPIQLANSPQEGPRALQLPVFHTLYRLASSRSYRGSCSSVPLTYALSQGEIHVLLYDALRLELSNRTRTRYLGNLSRSRDNSISPFHLMRPRVVSI